MFLMNKVVEAQLHHISSSIRTYDLRAVRRKVDKLTAELGKAKVRI